MLSLNRKQEPKVGTTVPVLWIHKICHKMTLGTPLFSFKIILTFPLFPKSLLKRRSNVCTTSYYPQCKMAWNWWFTNTRKSCLIETSFSYFAKRALWRSFDWIMWHNFSLDDSDTQISAVFCPTPRFASTSVMRWHLYWNSFFMHTFYCYFGQALYRGLCHKGVR